MLTYRGVHVWGRSLKDPGSLKETSSLLDHFAETRGLSVYCQTPVLAYSLLFFTFKTNLIYVYDRQRKSRKELMFTYLPFGSQMPTNQCWCGMFWSYIWLRVIQRKWTTPAQQNQCHTQKLKWHWAEGSSE